MKTGIALAKQLRQMAHHDTHAREMRALFVAQVLAYQYPVALDKTAEDILSEMRDEILDVINNVNEVLALDTKLTQSLVEKMVRARVEILQSVSDTTLLKACLTSPALEHRLNDDARAALTAVISQPEFEGHAVAALTAVAQNTSESRDE